MVVLLPFWLNTISSRICFACSGATIGSNFQIIHAIVFEVSPSTRYFCSVIIIFVECIVGLALAIAIFPKIMLCRMRNPWKHHRLNLVHMPDIYINKLIICVADCHENNTMALFVITYNYHFLNSKETLWVHVFHRGNTMWKIPFTFEILANGQPILFSLWRL